MSVKGMESSAYIDVVALNIPIDIRHHMSRSACITDAKEINNRRTMGEPRERIALLLSTAAKMTG